MSAYTPFEHTATLSSDRPAITRTFTDDPPRLPDASQAAIIELRHKEH